MRNFLLLGLGLSVTALLAQAVRGGRLDSFGLGLTTILTIYLLGGVTVGIIVGLLRPTARSLPGRMLVGFIAMLPVAGLIVVLAMPKADRMVGPIVIILIIAGVLGPLYALSLWVGQRIR